MLAHAMIATVTISMIPLRSDASSIFLAGFCVVYFKSSISHLCAFSTAIDFTLVVIAVIRI